MISEERIKSLEDEILFIKQATIKVNGEYNVIIQKLMQTIDILTSKVAHSDLRVNNLQDRVKELETKAVRNIIVGSGG
jgi:hypothetical protein